MNRPVDPDSIRQAAQAILQSSRSVAFTGAGISVESGIPPFRGPGGLWETVDPSFLDIRYFHTHPEDAWRKIRDLFYMVFGKATPNRAHRFLAELESAGHLQAVITQNIDNLHQEAGSQTVIEYHGNARRLVCTGCGQAVPFSTDVFDTMPPRCPSCNRILKPDFVFFGEMIPQQALVESDRLVRTCDLMLVIGTTGEVYPAAQLPAIARNVGATVVEINPRPSRVTPLAHTHLPMTATEAADALAAHLPFLPSPSR